MSTPASKFPLLKLPYLAFKEVLCHMNPVRILRLSTCSKRSELNVKSVKMNLTDQYDLSVRLSHRSKIKFRNRVTTDSITHNERQDVDALQPMAKVVNMTERAFQYFAVLPKRASFWLGMSRECDESILRWANNHANSIKEASLMGEQTTENQTADDLLRLFKDCDSLSVAVHFLENFVCTIPLAPKSLIVAFGSWLRLDDCWNIPSKTIIITGGNYQNVDVNRFLKDWKTGARAHPRWDDLTLEKGELNAVAILTDIDHLEQVNQNIQFQTIINDSQEGFVDVVDSEDFGVIQFQFHLLEPDE